jgi:2-aminoethylphosphonate-pyruvate transaminase
VKALILAAGDGARLHPITQHLPKAMLPIGSETVISRLLRQLADSGVAQVCVVVGYQGDQLRRHVTEAAERLGTEVTFVTNSDYSRTSTAFSVWLASAWVGDAPFLLIDGDLVVTDEVLIRTARCVNSIVAYERRPITGPEEMKVAVRVSDGQETAARLGKNMPDEEVAGECIGIALFDETGCRSLFDALGAQDRDELATSYYERALNDVVAHLDVAMLRVDRADWTEIDFVTDYLEAAAKFGGSKDRQIAVISEQILLCPGPVRVSPAVKRALAHEDIGHRESEFVEVLTRTRQKLLQVYGVGSRSGYTDVILTGSGTAANEAVISSYCPGRRTLVLMNGEFGARLLDLCRCHAIDMTALDFGWTMPYRLDQIDATLASGNYDVVLMVHHETSTGMLNPVHQVGLLCSRHGVALCVDAISSIGAENLEVAEANITFCTGSANKAIGSLPGLAFVCGKKEAFTSLTDRQPRSRYLDLFRYFEFEEKRYQTPNTPAVSLFFALEAALDELLSETIEGRMHHYVALSSTVRQGFSAIGWKTVIPTAMMSRVLTTFYYPDDVDVEHFHQWIRQHDYIIYRGKGPLVNRAFQVANIGCLSKGHIERFVDVVWQYDRMFRRVPAA